MNIRLVVKLLAISFFIIFLIISGVFFSINMLKEEAVKTQVKLVQLYSSIFVDNFSRTIKGMDLLVDNINSFLTFTEDSSSKIDDVLSELLRNNPEIRSINILNENNKIINSSNRLNKDLNINLNSFYPKLQFKSDIFLVGQILEGRDFNNAKEIKYDRNRLDINFFPILKEITFKDKTYKVLIAINGDFLIHRYNEFINIDDCYIDLIRLDGKVLVSNDFTQKNKLIISDEEIFKTLIEKNNFSDIVIFNNEKSILAFNKTTNSPFGVIVRLNYEKSLQSWEKKRYIFLLIVFILIVISISLVISLLYLYNKKKNKELFLHKKFKTFFEQSNFFALIIDFDGKILEINQSFSSLLSKDDFLNENKKIWDYSCWPEHEKGWLKDIIENVTTNQKIQKELNSIDSNNEKRVLEFIFSSFEVDDKIEYVAIALDITSKKEKEHKLKQAYKVFENAHDGIIITDVNANIINVNKSFERNTGYVLDEVIGQNPKLLKSDLQDKDFYKNMWKELIKNNFWEGEIVNKRKDGGFYVERLKISTVYNENRELVNYIALFSDITLQKEQQKLIKEKEKILYQQSKMAAMGEMIGNIAHQWRQPLNVISVSASGIKLWIEDDLYSEEDAKDFIEAILNSTNYLSNTIDDFRNFYKDDLEKVDFNVKKSIEKTISLLKTVFIKEHIKIIYLSEEKLFINGVENQFLQLMMNILNNAKDVLVENNIEDKCIFIDMYEKENHKYIEIIDNGGGVGDDIIEHIFEPYFTTKHKSLGTGIGLYMSEEIVTKQLSGKLYVYNKAIKYKNKDYYGACFKIKI
ncbi:MAG: PAS domain S-box protein [Aliarcobacter sp.]|nr:PAS domain S-box protein [Aliarcobacter sp.]